MTKEKNKCVINVGFCFDDNYAKYTGVTVASILSNSKQEDNIHFYFVTNNITEENKEKILSLKSIKACEMSFIKPADNLFDEFINVKTDDRLPLASFFRLKLSSILKDVDKIIYLDCDTVVNVSLREMFETDISDYPLGGVHDISRRRLSIKTKFGPDGDYINSGVLLLNLKKMREDNVEEQFLTYSKEYAAEIFLGDQHVINYVLKDGKIKVLHPKWNTQVGNFESRSYYSKYPSIVHYIGCQKPWLFGSRTYFKDFYYKYLDMTPWKLSEEEKKTFFVKNEIKALINYFLKRPLFLLYPKFWIAFYWTYIYKYSEGEKS